MDVLLINKVNHCRPVAINHGWFIRNGAFYISVAITDAFFIDIDVIV